ncbi:MAG: putative aminohydrolase SsnA [Candidatus Limnocylindria bacterium]
MSLLLANATVVRSLHPPVVVSGDVEVSSGRVGAIGPGLQVAGTNQRIDCTGCLVVPGNVCAHTHAYSALARGMPYHLPPPTSFLEILQRVWWRLDRALDLASIRASGLVAAREALLAGTTTLVDHHASPNAIDGSLDALAEAFAEVGIRSVLCYEVTDRDGPERAAAGVEENRTFLRRAAEGRWPLARGMVGAHASFTLSDETLAACVALAHESGAGIHVHLAEDQADQADAEARFGQRATPRLAGAGALTDASLAAHAIHLTAAEADLLRANGVTVAHNPRSNMNNAVGRAPLAWLGPRLALGTDGIGADMFEESRVAYLRLREEGLDTPTGWPLAALAEGSALAGRLFSELRLGRIEVGAPADLVVLDYAAPTPMTGDSLASHWIFGLSAASVRDVLVDGEVVVRDRRLTRVDDAQLVLEAREQTIRLWDRLEQIGPHPFSPIRLLATMGGA